jgi:hypothetical protein
MVLPCQVNLQWFWILLYAALIIPFSPFIVNPRRYFRYFHSAAGASVKQSVCLGTYTEEVKCTPISYHENPHL